MWCKATFKQKQLSAIKVGHSTLTEKKETDCSDYGHARVQWDYVRYHWWFVFVRLSIKAVIYFSEGGPSPLNPNSKTIGTVTTELDGNE